MKFTAINQFIKATELRVVDEAGKQIGVMSKQEALNIAHDRGI